MIVDRPTLGLEGSSVLYATPGHGVLGDREYRVAPFDDAPHPQQLKDGC